MGSAGQAAADGAPAVFEERGAFSRDLRRGEDLVLIVGQRGGVEEGDLRLQDGAVAGRPDVVRDHVREPEQVVGNSRADPGTTRRMPPVLDVPLRELPAGGQQDLVAGQLGAGGEEGQDILQLIAKAEGAAGLVKGGTSPDAAAQRLVLQPAVDQQVGGQFGGAHFDRPQERIPPGPGPIKCVLKCPILSGSGAPVAGPVPPTRPVRACR